MTTRNLLAGLANVFAPYAMRHRTSNEPCDTLKKANQKF